MCFTKSTIDISESSPTPFCFELLNVFVCYLLISIVFYVLVCILVEYPRFLMFWMLLMYVFDPKQCYSNHMYHYKKQTHLKSCHQTIAFHKTFTPWSYLNCDSDYASVLDELLYVFTYYVWAGWEIDYFLCAVHSVMVCSPDSPFADASLPMIVLDSCLRQRGR